MSVILVSMIQFSTGKFESIHMYLMSKIMFLYNPKTIPLYMSAKLCTDSIEVIDDFLKSSMNTQLYLKYKFKVLSFIKESS